MRDSHFIFDDVSISPDRQIGRHFHQSWELSYVIKGTGIHIIGDMSEPIAEKEIILIPPGINHEWIFDRWNTDCDGEISNISVIFSPSYLKSLSSIFPELSETVSRLMSHHEAISLLGEDRLRIERLLLSMRGLTATQRLPKMIELIILLAGSTNHSVAGHGQLLSEAKKRLDRLRIFLVCNYARVISLDEIADYIGMNKSSLCTFMRKHTGMTLTEYLNTIRLDVACDHLLHSDENISVIAYESGFSDVTYFNRLFHRRFGMTPSAYKRQHKYYASEEVGLLDNKWICSNIEI